MHTVFYEVFFIPDGILCYEVFERNDIIETKAVHFFKKVSWLSSKCFSTNYTERTWIIKVKGTWRNLLVMISTQQEKVLK